MEIWKERAEEEIPWETNIHSKPKKTTRDITANKNAMINKQEKKYKHTKQNKTGTDVTEHNCENRKYSSSD